MVENALQPLDHPAQLRGCAALRLVLADRQGVSSTTVPTPWASTTSIKRRPEARRGNVGDHRDQYLRPTVSALVRPYYSLGGEC